MVGAICGAAVGLDLCCRHYLGIKIGAATMLLLTGYITTIYRQVSCLPKPCHFGQSKVMMHKRVSDSRRKGNVQTGVENTAIRYEQETLALILLCWSHCLHISRSQNMILCRSVLLRSFPSSGGGLRQNERMCSYMQIDHDKQIGEATIDS